MTSQSTVYLNYIEFDFLLQVESNNDLLLTNKNLDLVVADLIEAKTLRYCFGFSLDENIKLTANCCQYYRLQENSYNH